MTGFDTTTGRAFQVGTRPTPGRCTLTLPGKYYDTEPAELQGWFFVVVQLWSNGKRVGPLQRVGRPWESLGLAEQEARRLTEQTN